MEFNNSDIKKNDSTNNDNIWETIINDYISLKYLYLKFYYAFINIVKLDVSSCKLTILPKGISKLKFLKCINISHNTFYYLPYVLSELQYLCELHASGNFIIALPKYLKEMPNLTVLDVYNNYIDQFDYSDLMNLKCFDMADNCKDEPNSNIYLKQKSNLRSTFNFLSRIDKRKKDLDELEDSDDCTDSDDDWFTKYERNSHPHRKIPCNYKLLQDYFNHSSRRVYFKKHVFTYEAGQFDDAD